MRNHRLALVAVTASAAVVMASPAWAATATAPVLTTGESPFDECTADDVEAQDGIVYPDSELEPFIDVSNVDRNGDGSVGKVTNTLYVRVGSQLNGMKAKVATKLEPG